MNKKDQQDFKEQAKLQSLKDKSEESRESVTGYLETGNPKEAEASKRVRSSGFK